MRKLAPILTALLVLLAALLVSPVGVLAASSGGPLIPGPDGGGRSSAERVASTRLPAGPSISIAAPVACSGGFNAVASPSPGDGNVLLAMSAVSVNDVWEVGYRWVGTGYDQTLIEHWDGTGWSVVPSSNPGGFHNDLNGVVAISANDVWVVGSYWTTSNGSGIASFALHWNGSSWNFYVILPYPTNVVSELLAVTATAGSDVWAVGNYYSAGWLPWVAHWDGTSWTPTTIAYPGNGSDSQLVAVSAWSNMDVWAVGEFNSGSGTRQSWATHWNGSAWSTISTPNSASGANIIFGVAALEANHAVAVGYGNFVSGVSPRQSQAWDLLATGTSTTSTLGTSLGSGDNNLNAVKKSGTGVQAVGYQRFSATAPRQTLAIPAAWDPVGHTLTWGVPGASANPGAANDVFFDAAALSSQTFWATGYSSAVAGADQTLNELNCGHVAITGPSPTYVGAPFSLTVTAQNPSLATVTSYRGTLHFTSNDSGAVLPADYTFTAPDAGVHVFTGVVLNTPGPITITATDPVTSYVTGTGTFNVSCLGACPGPGGTAGARDTNSGPTGTAGSRDANQSGASTAGPRRPTVAPGDSVFGATSAPATGLAPAGAATTPASTAQAAAPAIAAAPIEAQVAAIAGSQSEQPLTMSGGDMMAASRAPLTKVEKSPGYPSLALISLAIMSLTLLVVRRQRNRRLLGHTRP